MKNERSTDMGQLLRVLGIEPKSEASSGDDDEDVIRLLADIRTATSEAEEFGDEKQARILQKTLGWIEQLSAQAGRLTRVAEHLFERLIESRRREVGGAEMEDVIERLEWVLAGLESWIEQQQPDLDGARFHLSLDSEGDALASWKTAEGSISAPVSLRSVVQGLAQVDGEFPEESAKSIAKQVVEDVSSGAIGLLRVRRLSNESTQGEVVFELMDRESFSDEVAREEESYLVPASLEAKLDCDEAEELAKIMDEAMTVAACGLRPRTRYGKWLPRGRKKPRTMTTLLPEPDTKWLTDAAPMHAALTTQLMHTLEPTALRFDLTPNEMFLCVYSIASRRYQASGLSGDQQGLLRYQRVLDALTVMVTKVPGS